MTLAATLIINRLYRQIVELAPQSQAALRTLQGKLIVIEVTDMQKSWGLRLFEDEVQFANSDELSQFDVKISADKARYWSLLRAEDKQQTMMSEAFTIAGNTQTMMALQRFMEHFTVDVEGLVANYIGQIPAHQLAGVAKVGQQLWSDVYQSQLASAKNYLHYEARLVADADEIQQQGEQIRLLRDQTDRLQARVQRLQAQITRKLS